MLQRAVVSDMAENSDNAELPSAPVTAESAAAPMFKDSFGFLLNRTGVAMGNAFSQELKKAGMTLAMWRVLAALHDTGRQSLSGLSDYVSVEISTLSRQVATLATRGFVVSQQSEDNWRSVDISLTAAGQVVVRLLLPATIRHERAALYGIDPGDAELLKRLLEKIYGNLCTLDEVLPVADDLDHLVVAWE